VNILSLPLGADTGGVTAAIGRAFEGQDGWEFRSIISTLNYLDYSADLRWSRETVEHYWRWADVIHLHHNLAALSLLRRKSIRVPPRSLVVEYHGTGFREAPERHLNELRRHGALGLVSTLDLWLISPRELEWLPCPVGERTRKMRNDGMVRIAHAPTDRDIKSTGAFLAASQQLKDEGHPIEVDLIEGVTWAECLERKAQADVYFDQVKLGYGNNAIEAWGMGIPVIAGAQPATLEEMVRRFGDLPFYNATEDTIYDALKAMLNPSIRELYAHRGLMHVRKFHDERVVVEQLKDIYRRAAT
jgi:hypothetical protein